MKFRRHHNNTGEHQVRTGQTRRQVERMADRLGIPMYTNEDAFIAATRARIDAHMRYVCPTCLDDYLKCWCLVRMCDWSLPSKAVDVSASLRKDDDNGA